MAKPPPSNYEPDAGDFVWLDLNPTEGHEQRGHRPALVLSPIEYNTKTGLLICVPITSHAKGHPFEQKLPAGMKPEGAVLCDQIRRLAWRERNVQYISRAPVQLTQKVRGRIGALIGIS